jgi:hypothetical protein
MPFGSGAGIGAAFLFRGPEAGQAFAAVGGGGLCGADKILDGNIANARRFSAVCFSAPVVLRGAMFTGFRQHM